MRLGLFLIRHDAWVWILICGCMWSTSLLCMLFPTKWWRLSCIHWNMPFIGGAVKLVSWGAAIMWWDAISCTNGSLTIHWFSFARIWNNITLDIFSLKFSICHISYARKLQVSRGRGQSDIWSYWYGSSGLTSRPWPFKLVLLVPSCCHG